MKNLLLKEKTYWEKWLYAYYLFVLVVIVAGLLWKQLPTGKLVSPLPPLAPNAHAIEDIRPTYEYSKQERFVQYVKRLTGRNAHTLIAIATCEGLFHKTQINTANSDLSEDRGALQINSVHYKRIPGNTIEEKRAWLMVPENNALFGYSLFLEQGTGPWYSSRHCWEGKI